VFVDTIPTDVKTRFRETFETSPARTKQVCSHADGRVLPNHEGTVMLVTDDVSEIGELNLDTFVATQHEGTRAAYTDDGGVFECHLFRDESDRAEFSETPITTECVERLATDVFGIDVDEFVANANTPTTMPEGVVMAKHECPVMFDTVDGARALVMSIRAT